ncbi:MAG: histidine--tRNA ligase [Candidatus Harrisonbacteria bacterium CG10_big_fil_rev_8_21_14_0_10_42_17]|uniref:Histidine--tRNA ligase n=1 Tax=Candidatus Harrisonbacteria bacterium CG10_big_fil_rev_8_21_14_0_10_42_17 TaxID=1974584 RepID=A0A2M6WIK9_9BACT|nr:MAG: histidine--tRNA ligase [Candidatus Harrisonbacteria bacterium CG10_big_fil_rev_8_21_14_0_10_42_17]
MPSPQKKKTEPKKDFQTPRGMRDILPRMQYIWEKVRKTAKDIGGYYNFSRIETPIVEYAELFERGVGKGTDIVEKEMFTVHSKSKDRLVMRPEGTAACVRAYNEHGMSHLSQPVKLYYEGPMFRHERPQAGRWRQHYQVGYELLGGESDPIYDAQIILVAVRFFEELKINDLEVRLNSIGCKTCRPPYIKELLQFYRSKKKELCVDCKNRLTANPLRLLDCKQEACIALRVSAPIFVDHLCKDCNDHFKAVLEYLEELHLPYVLDHYLVRGLDYYSHTVFELVTQEGKLSLAGGGRYNYLIELLGGKKTPAVGVAIGLDRTIDLILERKLKVIPRQRPKVFLICVGELAKKRSLTLIEHLRTGRIDVQESLGKISLNAQLKSADKHGAPIALLFGQKEAFEESVIVRDMKTGAQETVPIAKMADIIRKKL